MGQHKIPSQTSPSMSILPTSATQWTPNDVKEWLIQCGFGSYAHFLCDVHKINGTALLMLTEDDLKNPPLKIEVLGDIKNLSLHLSHLKQQHKPEMNKLGSNKKTKLPLLSISYRHPESASKKKPSGQHDTSDLSLRFSTPPSNWRSRESSPVGSESNHSLDGFTYFASPADGDPLSPGMATQLEPEIWKTILSFSYFVLVTIITSLTMVLVHDRVPDMKKYPPLPDLFLDHVPLIPWAFGMCEITGCLLMFVWLLVLVFHKHRSILMRRFFALTGTVFLLRCVTMMITSLSVPGSHLECAPRPYGDIWAKLSKALEIWQGFGMSVRGVRTCGDYMFSGHTVTLTMLNFFITEYTPRRIYFLHTFTWILNLFGIFFILAAREHYSIDVFVAFYITSRVFLYYHTLANSRALRQRDRYRARVWFPLFSFFESRIDGMVPNEYHIPWADWSLTAVHEFRLRTRKLLYRFWKSLTLNRKQHSNGQKRSKKRN